MAELSIKVLNITNGDSLTNYLKELQFSGDFLTWREMLCEGPTVPLIDSEEFYKIRRSFLSSTYDIANSEYSFEEQIKLLDNADDYDEIHLWFEYDLFCHINLMACISALHQKEIQKPIYLICSAWIEGEKNLKGLPELTPNQLNKEFNNRTRLEAPDIALAVALWRTYCGKDHTIFKSYITQSSNFKYLTNCLKAHLKRFPNTDSGLSTIEENILKLIDEYDIKSKHHLLGYCLNYQGYYGFGYTQYKRIIDKLSPFFEVSEDELVLNENEKKAINKSHNFINELRDDIPFGGVNRMHFQFNTKENLLVKIN